MHMIRSTSRSAAARLAMPLVLALCAVWSCNLSFGQVPEPEAADNLQIRGTVEEPNPVAGAANAGISGVQVKLTEFQLINNVVTPVVIATAFTDNQGTFLFRPPRLGRFMVEIQKDGYAAPTPLPQSDEVGRTQYPELTRTERTAQLRFTLTRPGEFSGRVLDEDGKPVANLRVEIQTQPLSLGITATTNADGYFTSPKLSPGRYLVQIRPKAVGAALVRCDSLRGHARV